MKSPWNCLEKYKHVNNFCDDIQDRLDNVFQKPMGMKRSQNLSKKEKAALRILQYIFNGTDKKFGPACLTKKVTFRKNKRQLCEKRVYNKLTQEEAEQLIRIIKKRLTPIVNT